jgi:hypothetical protein
MIKIKSNKHIILFIILIAIFYVIYNTININKYELFIITDPQTTQPQKLERTQLYGSLFLDNLDQQIKNMTNPDIKYDTKRIQLNNYSDILF